MIDLSCLVEKVLAAGADQVQVKRAISTNKNVFFESNKLKTIKVDHDSTISFKVLVDNKKAVSSTNSQDLAEIEKTIKEVIQVAKISAPDRFNTIAAKQSIEPVAGIFDDYIPELSETLALACQMVDATHAFDKRVTIDTCLVKWSHYKHEVANSNGLYCREKSSATQLSLLGMACDGKIVSSFDYDGVAEISWQAAKEKAPAIVESFCKGLIESLDAVPAPKFEGLVLFSPEITGEILELLSTLVNARNVQENSSRFAEKLNQAVTSEIVTIIDQPLKAGAITSTAYDAEGVATRDLTIIEKGILKNYIYDCYAAKKAGIESTGHSQGGSYVGLHAPTILPTDSLDNLKKQIDKGVYAKRFSGDMNPKNGLISGLIKGGHYIEAGSNQSAVAGTTINTNLFDLFFNIVGISEELEDTDYGPQPYLLVKEIDVIGD